MSFLRTGISISRITQNKWGCIVMCDAAPLNLFVGVGDGYQNISPQSHEISFQAMKIIKNTMPI